MATLIETDNGHETKSQAKIFNVKNIIFNGNILWFYSKMTLYITIDALTIGLPV